MDPALETLFLPLENGDVPMPGRTLFIGASGHPYLRVLGTVDTWQPFKPLADTLGSYDVRVLEGLPEERDAYDLVMIAIPKQGEEARYWIARGLFALKPSGRLLVAAANDAGGSRLQKWLKDAGMETDNLSKNKARAVWGLRPAALPPIIEEWSKEGSVVSAQSGDGVKFLSQPGIFGWNKIDSGSALLASHFADSRLKGRGADFGAGTGYLARVILESGLSVKELYIIEADARALSCARENLAAYREGCTLHFHWADLGKPQGAIKSLDFIIMNPPFHAGAKTDIGLGRNFIDTAAKALHKGGVLMMVANRQLPYEAVLEEKFSSVRIVTEKDGFKVIEAVL